MIPVWARHWKGPGQLHYHRGLAKVRGGLALVGLATTIAATHGLDDHPVDASLTVLAVAAGLFAMCWGLGRCAEHDLRRAAARIEKLEDEMHQRRVGMELVTSTEAEAEDVEPPDWGHGPGHLCGSCIARTEEWMRDRGELVVGRCPDGRLVLATP